MPLFRCVNVVSNNNNNNNNNKDGDLRRSQADPETGDDRIGFVRLLPQEPEWNQRRRQREAPAAAGGLCGERVHGPGGAADRNSRTGGSLPNGLGGKAVAATRELVVVEGNATRLGAAQLGSARLGSAQLSSAPRHTISVVHRNDRPSRETKDVFWGRGVWQSNSDNSVHPLPDRAKRYSFVTAVRFEREAGRDRRNDSFILAVRIDFFNAWVPVSSFLGRRFR
eukprot:jgi/Psemu1/62538/estExt_Genemark1.C_30238